MKHLLLVFGFMMLLACNESGNNINNENGTSDSTQGDSMPVVNPGPLDTSSVVKPPPTNDQNNAYPDTSKPGN